MTRVRYSRTATRVPATLGVAEKLMRLVNLTPEEIENMTEAQAVDRLNQFCTEQ
ncbi:hypothetical protein [Nocardia miyunensis]|uniref:hypothetical protein n=1 Tax=Nocardia miyunensis TaxID=282684 RepID=UPI000AB514E8|nr:hypothetical protein [Nocardia miyunensis]